MCNNSKFITVNKYSKLRYFNLSFILKDLFSEINPIIELKAHKNSDSVLIYQINSFMPKNVLDMFKDAVKYKKSKKSKIDYYNEFTHSSNTFTLGNKVIEAFNENGIIPFVRYVENNNNLLINKPLLKEFLNSIKNFVFADSSSIISDTVFEKYKEIYNLYLNHNKEISVLTRVIISTIILQKQSYNFPKPEYLHSFMVYNLSSTKFKKLSNSDKKIKIEELLKSVLDKVWFKFCNNPSESKIFEEFVLINYKKDNFALVKSICELNKELLNKKENIALKYLYAVSLLQLGDISKCEKTLNEACFEKYPDAKFTLYRIYNNDFGEFFAENKAAKRKKALTDGAYLAQPNAVIMLVRELFSDFNKNYQTIKALLWKLNEKISSLDDTMKADFYYYLACCKEKDNLPEDAKHYFDKALKFGNERARAKASRALRKTYDFSKAFKTENFKNLCVINSNNESTRALLRTLPDDYAVYAINADFKNTEIENIFTFFSIKACIDNLILKITAGSKVIISFLNDDDRENLNNGLEVLDRLFNEALNKNQNDRISFINTFDIYIKSEYEYASAFIDANISDMGDDVFFKTHIIDPYRSSILKLFYEKPVFLPILTSKAEKQSNIILLSNSVDFSFSVVKELMAISYMGKAAKTNITVISNDEIIEKLSKKLQKKMPGAYINNFSKKLSEIINNAGAKSKEKNNLSCSQYPVLKPDLKSYDIYSSDFLSLLLGTSAYEISDDKFNDIFNLSVSNNLPSEEKAEVHKFYKILNSANYFIINVGTDEENIDFAINIRRQILANSPNMDKKPFVSVYCENQKTAYLANRITLSNKNQGDHYHNKYDLYFFGMADTLYSYNNLVNNTLEQQALEIHKSYCGLSVHDSFNENTHGAYNSYYSYQYNQDSSMITAIALRYRLFFLGLYKGKNLSSEFTLEEDCDLSEEFNKYLNSSDKSIDDELAKTEQIRWNNYMLSRGWSAPNQEQLKVYLNDNSITNHKHMLLKLHPYIADWDDLDDDGEICKAVKNSNKEFESPRDITRQSIKDTVKWFSIFKEKSRER